MDNKKKEKIIKEFLTSYEDEIVKIERAISSLKEKYQENLTDLENKLESAKFQKETFEKIKI